MKNRWHLDLRKTCDHQNWIAAISAGVDLFETNQAAAGDIITFRSCDLRKYYKSL